LIAQGSADHAPGLPLALGFGSALYHMRTKASSLPRSAGITALGLSLGTLMGVALQAALRVDIIPLGPLSTPSTVVAEGALAGMFAVRAIQRASPAAAAACSACHHHPRPVLTPHLLCAQAAAFLV